MFCTVQLFSDIYIDRLIGGHSYSTQAGHILHKIFNKNTVKISYSCMKNINSVISSHNKTF